MTNSTDQSTVEQTNVTNQTSSNERKDEPLVTGEYGPYTGNCKWFNNKIGYGFITVMDGDHKGKDIFVHHSGLKLENNNIYKILYQGEYVEYDVDIKQSDSKKIAVNVTGMLGGQLMCEVRSSETKTRKR